MKVAFSKPDKSYNVRYVSVPGGGGSKAVYFPIVPTEIGNVKLSVLAQAGHAGDAVEMPLRVEPEGYRVERNVPVVIDLTPTGNNSGSFQKSIELQFPSDYVEGSRKARIDVIGGSWRIDAYLYQNVQVTSWDRCWRTSRSWCKCRTDVENRT